MEHRILIQRRWMQRSAGGPRKMTLRSAGLVFVAMPRGRAGGVVMRLRSTSGLMIEMAAMAAARMVTSAGVVKAVSTTHALAGLRLGDAQIGQTLRLLECRVLNSHPNCMVVAVENWGPDQEKNNRRTQSWPAEFPTLDKRAI